MFDISLYNDDFFEWHVIHARDYSISNMDWYIDTYNPKSVIDFGCGIGSYLESAYNKNLKIKGYEISKEAIKYTPLEIREFIKYRDCTKPIKTDLFDCVICTETAEHIEPKGTDQFLKNLFNACGDTLIFTAAPPDQGGLGHINCQPKEYWMEKISELGLIYNEGITEFVKENWKRLGCPFYIENNLLIFNHGF